jgi:hypothetical protein
VTFSLQNKIKKRHSEPEKGYYASSIPEQNETEIDTKETVPYIQFEAERVF